MARNIFKAKSIQESIAYEVSSRAGESDRNIGHFGDRIFLAFSVDWMCPTELQSQNF